MVQNVCKRKKRWTTRCRMCVNERKGGPHTQKFNADGVQIKRVRVRLHDAMMKESGINEVNTILFRPYGEKSMDTSLRWPVYV